MTDKMEVLETFDPMAFVLALIGAPILVAVFGFWLAIPIYALIGVPIYLVFGTPVLLWMVTRYPLNGKIYARAGLLVQSALTVIYGSYVMLAAQFQLVSFLFFAFCCLVFASIWAGVFALLYRSMYRPARLFPVF